MLGLLGMCLASGVAIGYLLFKVTAPQKQLKDQLQQFQLELRLEKERSDRQLEDIASLNGQLREEREQLLRVNSERATLEANYENMARRLTEQKEELTSLQDKFTAQFKNLANEIFEEKSIKFTNQNKSNLDDLLKPLGQKLTDFERKVELTHKDHVERNIALKEQLIGLSELNKRMSRDAENLTRALKGDSRIQGNWGELVLERILEQSGLQKNREYYTQESITTEAGKRLRPDVIIRLPDSKNLVIDAKASLLSYDRYMNAENDEDRERFLKEHMLSVKTHIRSLANKSYHQLFETGSLDYVLMFVPIEAAFALIIERGGELYNEAHNQNIVIVSPATLIATLRTVSSIWKHEYQNRNALEIARQGGLLYDKFKSFVDDLVKVGQTLSTTKNTYDDAMKKLVTGKDNLVRKTERLRELGAQASKPIDDKVLKRAQAKTEFETTQEDGTEHEIQSNLFGG